MRRLLITCSRRFSWTVSFAQHHRTAGSGALVHSMERWSSAGRNGAQRTGDGAVTGRWEPSLADATRARHEGVPKLEKHRPPGREPGSQPRQFLPALRQRSPQLGPLPPLTFTPRVTRAVSDHGVACTLIHLVSNWTLTPRSHSTERTPRSDRNQRKSGMKNCLSGF